jgi:hypothetical protein
VSSRLLAIALFGLGSAGAPPALFGAPAEKPQTRVPRGA